MKSVVFMPVPDVNELFEMPSEFCELDALRRLMDWHPADHVDVGRPPVSRLPALEVRHLDGSRPSVFAPFL